jgi:thiamine-phosphate pyrophosphorylase
MARCYSGCVPDRQRLRELPQDLPRIWLVSDARNDAVLERVLVQLPRGSGLIFRHYHLAPSERRTRFAQLLRLARRRSLTLVWSGTPNEARGVRAGGAYGPPLRLGRGPGLQRLATVHSLRELAFAHRARADAVLISPVFPTDSHPGAPVLGPIRFRLLADWARVPVIALGGMSAKRARGLGGVRWAAVASFAQAR